MPNLFEDLNDHIVFIKVNSRNEALKNREEARKKATSKTVVIFFDNRYHLYLAPMQDPYKIRREIDEWMNQSKTQVAKPVTKPIVDDSPKPTATLPKVPKSK